MSLLFLKRSIFSKVTLLVESFITNIKNVFTFFLGTEDKYPQNVKSDLGMPQTRSTLMNATLGLKEKRGKKILF